MATVWIPSLLRELTGGLPQVEVPGSTVGQLVTALDARYPGIQERLCEGKELSAALAVSVDGRVGRRGLQEPVGPRSEVHFLPPVEGG